MLDRGSYLVIGVLIFLLVVTSWFAASLTRIPSFQGSGLTNMGVLTNAEVIQTTNNGLLQYQGSIKTANQFNNGNINFEGLNVILYENGSTIAPWTLSSDTGTIIDNNQQINLEGHVVLKRPGVTNTPPILVQTNSASIYPNDQLVKGSDLITISQPGSINQTTAVGFVANLQQKWIKLLSEVKSTYAPAR